MATAPLLVFPGIPWAWERLWLCPRSLCLPCAASLSPGSSQQSPPGALFAVVLSGIWFFLYLPSCVSVGTPRAFQVAFGVLEASEDVHCTPKFSLCLPLHPRALPGPASTSRNSVSEPRALQAPLPAPWVSPWVFLSPHLDFWTPWDPPCDSSCAPVPSVWLAEHLLGTWPCLSAHREGGGRGGQLGGLPKLSPMPAWPTWEEGTPLSPGCRDRSRSRGVGT